MEKSLIVGLGNPGELYKTTRHNIGFRVVEEIARRNGLTLRKKIFCDGWCCESSLEGAGFYLLQPALYMNRSGESITRTLCRYNIQRHRLLVIVDDITLSFGALRIRIRSGSGGHNGLKSIALSLGTNDYARLRIGIGSIPGMDLNQYVLSNFSSDEEKLIPDILERAAQTAEIWLTQGLTSAMNHANGKHFKKQNSSQP